MSGITAVASAAASAISATTITGSPSGTSADPAVPTTPATPASAGSKKRASPSADDTPLTLKKQKPAGPYDKYVHPIKVHARTHRPFIKVEAVFSSALDRLADLADLVDEEELDFESEIDRKLWAAWVDLTSSIPGLERAVIDVQDFPAKYKNLCNTLDAAVSTARSDDTKKMKEAVADFLRKYKRSRKLFLKPKSCRGFQNDITGAFLCPVNVQWGQNSSDTAALRDGRLRPKPDQWSNFLYPANPPPRSTNSATIANSSDDDDDDDDDDDNTLTLVRYLPVPTFSINERAPWAGIFESDLMYKAYAILFRGGAIYEKGKRLDSGGIGNEMPNGVTKASLAWTAVQVRHALSTEDRFVANATGSEFNNVVFC